MRMQHYPVPSEPSHTMAWVRYNGEKSWEDQMIGAAVVGLGWWGRNVEESLRDSDVIRPVLGVDPDAAGRQAFTDRGIHTSSDLHDALDDPRVDAVVLCTPHRMHTTQVIAAAEAGKHVFCEKPFSMHSGEAERALSAVRDAGVRLGIGHERRFEPAIQEMQARFRSGELGVPLVLEGNFSQDKFLSLPAGNWRLSATEAPAGPLSATGIHLVDLAISLFGRPRQVWARLSTRATDFANGDTLTITLGFDEGETALITAVLTTPFIGRVCVMGSRGWIEIRDRNHPEDPRGWDVTTVRRGEDPEVRFFPPHRSVRANLEAFAHSISASAEYPITLSDVRANVTCVEAILRSIENGGVESAV
jgi:predicted dehydrogenase